MNHFLIYMFVLFEFNVYPKLVVIFQYSIILLVWLFRFSIKKMLHWIHSNIMIIAAWCTVVGSICQLLLKLRH